MNTM